MYRGKTIFVYGIAATSVIGIVSAAISEKKFRKQMKREIADIKMFQNMENDFLNRHSKKVAEELEEIRDEIGTVYGHLEAMGNIRKCGR